MHFLTLPRHCPKDNTIPFAARNVRFTNTPTPCKPCLAASLAFTLPKYSRSSCDDGHGGSPFSSLIWSNFNKIRASFPARHKGSSHVFALRQAFITSSSSSSYACDWTRWQTGQACMACNVSLGQHHTPPKARRQISDPPNKRSLSRGRSPGEMNESKGWAAG